MRMTREERLELLKQIEKDIHVGSLVSTLLEDAKSCAIHSVIEELEQEPKAKTFDILRFVADNAGLSIFEAIEKAYNMGVSEQEPILDKIIADIEEKGFNSPLINPVFTMTEIIDIIDKYRESEG